MHNSKLIIKSIIFCVLLVSLSCLMTFLLYPLSSMNKKFIAYHNYSKTNKIDFLVLGNSLEGNGLRSEIINQELGVNSYIFTPQGSYPESLYYILVDIANKHPVRNLIVGWDIIQNFQQPAYIYPHSEELYREFLADLKGNFQLQKIVFLNIMHQRFTSTFFKWSSFPENILEIPAVLESKNKNKIEPTHISRPIDIKELESYSSFNFYKVMNNKYAPIIQSHDIEFLTKIRDFCISHDIKLLVISNPIPNCISIRRPELQDCIEISKKLMLELEINYVNTSEQDLFPGSTIDSNFKDCFGHIISPYSELYTKQLCKWIKSNFVLNDAL